MLDTRFERGPGDIGHPATWPCPVRFRVVSGATASRVVNQTDPDLLELFIAAGRELVEAGARLITTSCGFLALYQRELAAALPVPVVTSALLQVGWLQALLAPDRKVGIITASRRALSARHLAAAGIGAPVAIVGFAPTSHFHRVVVDGQAEALDRDRVATELTALAGELLAIEPATAAIVLECTNLPPWSAMLARETGLPVHDIRTAVLWLRAGLAPTPFAAPVAGRRLSPACRAALRRRSSR